MELIFLSEQDLTILDHAYATDDYDIIFDALVPQKSSFVVNKQVLNCGIGDLLITRDNGYGYVGIITAIEKDDKNRNKVKTKDFLSLFDVDVPLPTSFSGNIAQFVVNLINNTYRYSGDSFQNISYLETAIEVVKSCSLTYEADSKENILDLVEEFSKTYGIRLDYEVVLNNGKFHKIKVKVVSAFGNRDFSKYLEETGDNNLIIVGLQTEYCIDATIKSAFEKGYKVYVPLGTNSTFDNNYMKAKKAIKYYNEWIWDGAFAEVISVGDAIKLFKQK